MPLSISSPTCSLVSRSIAVCHRASTWRYNPACMASCSPGVSALRSRHCSRRTISRSQSRMLLRWTSVGCAVSTGLTSASAKNARKLAPSIPAGLRTQHVAEKAAEQARIFLERQVFVGWGVHRSSARSRCDPIVASLHRFACAGLDRLSSAALSRCAWRTRHHAAPTRIHLHPTRSGMNEIASPSGWQALVNHRRALAGRSLAALFNADSQRFTQLSLAWDDWLADWSKQRLTAETMALLVAYAQERNLPAWIAAMFAAEKINLSERRPVLHTALRQQGDAPLAVAGADVIPAIRSAQARMRTLATQLRGGARLGATRRPIRFATHLRMGGAGVRPPPRLRRPGWPPPRARRGDRDGVRVYRRSPDPLTSPAA